MSGPTMNPAELPDSVKLAVHDLMLPDGCPICDGESDRLIRVRLKVLKGKTIVARVCAKCHPAEDADDATLDQFETQLLSTAVLGAHKS